MSTVPKPASPLRAPVPDLVPDRAAGKSAACYSAKIPRLSCAKRRPAPDIPAPPEVPVGLPSALLGGVPTCANPGKRADGVNARLQSTKASLYPDRL
jgi:hypothetical protein